MTPTYHHEVPPGREQRRPDGEDVVHDEHRQVPVYLRTAAKIWRTFNPGRPFPLAEAREIALSFGPTKLDTAIAEAARDGELNMESLAHRLGIESTEVTS